MLSKIPRKAMRVCFTRIVYGFVDTNFFHIKNIFLNENSVFFLSWYFIIDKCSSTCTFATGKTNFKLRVTIMSYSAGKKSMSYRHIIKCSSLFSIVCKKKCKWQRSRERHRQRIFCNKLKLQP